MEQYTLYKSYVSLNVATAGLCGRTRSRESRTAEQTESRLGDNTNVQGKDYFQAESKIKA